MWDIAQTIGTDMRHVEVHTSSAETAAGPSVLLSATGSRWATFQKEFPIVSIASSTVSTPVASIVVRLVMAA